MCGFAGIWWGGSTPPRGARDIAARMVEAIAHRGPDSESWIHSRHGILGFRRLSIIDPAHGHQPVRTPDGRIEALLNGEIYNHRELRPAIEQDAGPLPSGSDAEVIPPLYRRHGDGFVRRLDGMFAACVVDHDRGRLVIVRDRHGIKPLFHATVGPYLLVASELKAILAAGMISPRIDRASLLATLDRLHAPGSWTMIDGILSLSPGGRLIAGSARDGATPVISRWVSETVATPDPRERPDPVRLRRLLDEAVADQLVADVPVGIALSGGVDSTLIAESAARVRQPGDPPLVAITCDGPDTPPDEVTVARATARRLGLQHRVVRGGAAALDDRLPELAWMADDPVVDPAMLAAAWLSEAASQSVRVLLLGAGGDELFAGYPGVATRRFERAWASLPARLRGVMISRLAGGNERRRARLEAMGRTRTSRMAMHCLLRSQLPPEVRRELGEILLPGPGTGRDPFHAVHEAFDAAMDADLVTQQLHADLAVYLPDQLLAMFDRTTMAAGIEGRLPMLDRRFTEAAMAVHGRWKIGPRGEGKRLLRAMLEPGGGPATARRRKTGFASPVLPWMRDRMPTILRQLAEDPRSISATVLRPGWVAACLDRTPAPDWARGGWLYGLTVIETWYRLMVIDGRTSRPSEGIDALLARPPATIEVKPAVPAPEALSP